MRLATMLALLPIMDRRSVPLLWRLAVAVPLAWALAPAVLGEMPATVDMLRWELLVLEGLNSLLVGAVLGFAVSLVVNCGALRRRDHRHAGGVRHRQRLRSAYRFPDLDHRPVLLTC